MPEYEPTPRDKISSLPLSPKQIHFVSSRIHWGTHLPNDVIDGLQALKKGQVDPPKRKELSMLFDALISLERDEEKEPVKKLQTVREIVHEMCGWE